MNAPSKRPKRAVNVSIRADLLEEAKAFGLIDQVMERRPETEAPTPSADFRLKFRDSKEIRRFAGLNKS